MTTKTFSIVKRATQIDKYQMEEIIEAENKFQQQEPHGRDENDDDCPITYKMENHQGWQMQAYTPSDKMMNGFHQSFVRCGNCGTIFTWGGEDIIICTECHYDYSE